ncbi:MAG: rod shape-determining protein MreC [Bradymonadaceae bacterium]
MRPTSRARRKIAVGLLVVGLPALVVAYGGSTEVGGGESSAPVRWVRSGIGAVVAAEFTVAAGFADWFGDLVDGADSDRVARLRTKIESLREEKSRLIGVLQENMRLRELVGFQRDHPQYELAAAEVVSRDTTPYFRVISVEIEAEKPIEPGMAVVAAGGVVGRIHRVDGGRAEVVLAADPRSRIDAVSQRNRAHGVVRGLGHRRDYLAEVAYLRDRDAVRSGDLMVTTGMGGIFPPNLPVGRITSVDRSEQGRNQRVRLRPAVDFSRLREVFVVTGTED